MRDSLPAEGDARYEIKFVAPVTLRHRLESWILIHSAGFIEPYPCRRVNNVYFDTYGYSAYEENLVGSSSRQKIRYRWYGETFEPEAGSIELKLRRNRLGWKVAYPVAGVPLAGSSWSEIRRGLRNALPHPARVWLDANPLPVLINGYERRYFLSSDKRVRVTLDEKQCIFDQRVKSFPNLEHRANLPDTLVLEFKFAAGDRRLATGMIQGLPLRVSRNSKYVIGVQSIANI